MTLTVQSMVEGQTPTCDKAWLQYIHASVYVIYIAKNNE